MEEFDFYPWCGHAVVMGNKALSGQNTIEVLTRFGKRINKARPAYRHFVAEGIWSSFVVKCRYVLSYFSSTVQAGLLGVTSCNYIAVL